MKSAYLGRRHGKPLILSLAVLLVLASASGSRVHDSEFYAWRFRESVEKAMKHVTAILNQTRDMPLFGKDDNHVYDDKYTMTENLTNLWVLAQQNVLEAIGLGNEALKTAVNWASDDDDSVLLVFDHTKKCTLHETVEVEDDVVQAVEETGGTGLLGSIQRKTTSHAKIKTRYLWNATTTYEIVLCRHGSCEDDDNARIVLQSRTMSHLIGTFSKHKPVLEKHHFTNVNLKWWLQRLHKGQHDNKRTSRFLIDRSADTCKTPYRNDEMTEALTFRRNFVIWMQHVQSIASADLAEWQKQESDSGGSSGSLPDEKSLFQPVVPLNGTILSRDVIDQLVGVQRRLLQAYTHKLSESLTTELVPIATLRMVCRQIEELAFQYGDSVKYIENLLERQLVQAIGKHITASDFDEFFRHHQRRLLHSDYAPAPLSHAIRQPGQYPFGMVSIESEDGEPLQAFVKRIPGAGSALGGGELPPPIRIPISASIEAEMTGDRYLTGWMQNQFGKTKAAESSSFLAARARQFSSFLLFIGTMANGETFEPKQAMILKNKDEVLIPLLTHPLPSAKQFKNAIASLSPKQQAFAKAFRGMQLESSLFAVCIVQLKPQLERLLNLPDGALTKEIQLTEDLTTLFVEYQIPSDLLAFDGDADSTLAEKVAAVRAYSQKVLEIIERTKQEQLAEDKRKQELLEKKQKQQILKMATTTAQARWDEDEGAAHSSARYDGFVKARRSAPAAMPSSSLESNRGVPQESFHPQEEEMEEEFVESASGGEHSESERDISDSDRPSAEDNSQQQQESPATTSAALHDFTLIPKLLDAKLEQYDTEGYLRSTIIEAGPSWRLRRQENLLSKLKSTQISHDDIATETKRAFDLLDAISRSGTLPLEFSELHVIVGLTHQFPNTILDTIIQDNINPIEKVELSVLLICSTIFGVEDLRRLLPEAEAQRLSKAFPELIASSE